MPQKGLRDGVEKGLHKFEMSSVQAPVVQKVDSAIHWINLYPLDSVILILLVSLILIHWIVIYLAPVVQNVDNAIQWINVYPVDIVVGFPNTYPLDSDLSDG